MILHYKISGCEGKVLVKFIQVLADTLTKKIIMKMSAFSCVSEHSAFFYFLPTETYIFLADKGLAPPPLTDMSAKNVSFIWTAPLRPHSTSPNSSLCPWYALQSFYLAVCGQSTKIVFSLDNSIFNWLRCMH